MKMPKGYEVPGKEGYVCQLKKSLYGLCQAGRVWYDTLCDFLHSLGFSKSKWDEALFYRFKNGKHIWLALHVDDSMYVGDSLAEIMEVEKLINEKFPLKVMGDILYYLGSAIKRDRSKGILSVSQQSYIDEGLARFNLINSTPKSTPLPYGVRLGREFCPTDSQEIEEMKRIPYRELVGLLQWITETHPDISFATSILAQAADNPGRIHWEAGKHVFRYLKGTRDYCLTFGGDSKCLFEGYVDASHGSSDLGWKSMSGYVYMVNGGPVSWSAKKQEITALSSAEAEYIAMSAAARELCWIRNLIAEAFRPLRFPTTLHSDNQSAIAIAKKNSLNVRNKHIGLRYHFIRDCIKMDIIDLQWIGTDFNVADIFTKTLPAYKYKQFATSLGIAPA